MNAKKLVAGATAAAVLTLGAGTAVFAQGGTMQGQKAKQAIAGTLVAAPDEDEVGEGKDSDESLTGSPAQKATDAALNVAPGAVLEVEHGDDPGVAYEVEVRKADGGVAEVLLDGDFDVIGQEAGD